MVGVQVGDFGFARCSVRPNSALDLSQRRIAKPDIVAGKAGRLVTRAAKFREQPAIGRVDMKKALITAFEYAPYEYLNIFELKFYHFA